MGDLRVCSPEPNGPLLPPSQSLVRSESLASNQTEIGAHYWHEAEEATQEIISQVQPTLLSEERRREVIGYVQRLIRNALGCEVFPFGSVPLKTYLPDGDIDLTAFGGLNVEEALANDVCSVLEKEVQNRAAEFVVRDVQLIRAEVKLVKCLVQNIVVDISFNQLGGLCTLCFLEKVDCLIAKDHLFKCSIILIKAWCYYESRILGAHHGLISTYALETLVLYIFHLFHSSLNGPLAVLFKFLDYFSKFDWENYCISLNGPVRITSLPEIVAETPENGGGDLLLSSDFLKDCVEKFSSPSRGSEANLRTFPQKHLNIVDPLKENNNLGRSVSKGNFFRIRSAFTYGARKLGRILSHPEENIADEIRKFFSNTLDRHGTGQRPDVQDLVPFSRHNGFGPILSFSGTESYHEDQAHYESESAHSGFITRERKLEHEEAFYGGMNNIYAPGTERRFGAAVSEPQEISRKVVPSTKLEADISGITISEKRISGDAQDLATSKVQDLTISNDASKSSSPNGMNTSSLTKAHHAPHLYFANSFVANGEMRKESSDQNQAASSNLMKKKASSGFMQAPAEEIGRDPDESQSIGKREVLSPVGSKHRPLTLSSVAWSSEDLTSTGTFATPEAFNSLSDLTGDFESHLGSLHFGQWWLDCASNAPIPPVPPMMLSQFQSTNPWDAVRRSVQSRRNAFPPVNANGVVPRPTFYPLNPPMIPRAPFPMEEMPKPRGTGTYFPNTNHYRDRPLVARGRSPAPVRSPRNNGRVGTPFEPNSPGRVGTPFEPNSPERSSRELPQTQFHAQQGGGKYGSSDPPYLGSPRKKAYPTANPPLPPPSEKMAVLPSFAHLIPLGLPPPPLPECSKQQNSVSEVTQSPQSLSPPTQEVQGPKPVLPMPTEENRIAVQSYKLKDDEDFPPLSI